MSEKIFYNNSSSADKSDVIESNIKDGNYHDHADQFAKKIENNFGGNDQNFIKIIDIDSLSPEELVRIITAVGSRNMAYYLALIVNFENRSRKLSPQSSPKILSTRSVSQISPITTIPPVSSAVSSVINSIGANFGTKGSGGMEKF